MVDYKDECQVRSVRRSTRCTTVNDLIYVAGVFTPFKNSKQGLASSDYRKVSYILKHKLYSLVFKLFSLFKRKVQIKLLRQVHVVENCPALANQDASSKPYSDDVQYNRLSLCSSVRKVNTLLRGERTFMPQILSNLPVSKRHQSLYCRT